MDQKQFEKYQFPKEKFELAADEARLHDQKFETKPIGYFQDAMYRFSRNKASVVAAIIIGILVLFAIVGPYFCQQNYKDAYSTETVLINYKYLLPKLSFMEGSGIWDGTKKTELSRSKYRMYKAMEIERQTTIIVKDFGTKETEDVMGSKSTVYKVRLDSYNALTTMNLTLTKAEYEKLQAYQDENNVQIILPRVINDAVSINPNVWYQSDKKGNAILDAAGNFVPAYATSGKDDYHSLRLPGDPGNWQYAQRTGTEAFGFNYVLRIDPYQYFIYRFGYEPSFIFGTDSMGYDIISRLASGARFSFLLAVCVSLINLTIGAIYGAIEGYYGGAIDMVMERISDIISGIPFTVVTVLFNLHLAHKVGTVPALLFAFVLTGWIGMASRVRMQFYRFKNQEYVLASRTLGASDLRVMFKHIFPNSLGTIITGTVLVIPGVIFSETSLTYLGIINLESSTLSSVGSMLSAGQSCLTVAPHVVFFPAIFIALLEISFNLFGNGLRDAFNPSLRGSED